jgi:hypothetical protein
VLQVQDLDDSLVDESRFDDKDPKPFKFKEAQDEIWGSFDGPVLLLVITAQWAFYFLLYLLWAIKNP